MREKKAAENVIEKYFIDNLLNSKSAFKNLSMFELSNKWELLLYYKAKAKERGGEKSQNTFSVLFCHIQAGGRESILCNE